MEVASAMDLEYLAQSITPQESAVPGQFKPGKAFAKSV
jgi:hypothetical protein